MSSGSLSFVKLVMMSSAPVNSVGGGGGWDARYASQGPFIQSMLSSTITAPICVRSAFFIRRRQSLRLLFVVLQVARVFYYLSAAALQYLAPTILLLFSVLMLRGLGGYSVHTLNQQTFWFGLSCGQYTLIFMYQQQTMQDAVGIFYPYLFSSKQSGNHIWRAKSIYFTRFTSLHVALYAMDRVYPTAVL